MIKQLSEPTPEELDRLMLIWLEANSEAHGFIPRTYWQEQQAQVRALLPEAELFVATVENKIVGFLGLMDSYIAGLFVSSEWRSQGFGQKLLDFVKERTNHLDLEVYEKNNRAERFYQRNGFKRVKVTSDETGEKSVYLQWEK